MKCKSVFCQNWTKKVAIWQRIEEKIVAHEKGLLNKEKKVFSTYYETREIYEEAKKLAGLKKFLKDFSSIEDKSSIEVHLWEYYLIYAQIFGIADKVAKQFKDLYPEISEVKEYNFDNVMGNIILVNAMTSNGFSVADAAREAAQNYSAGGGGFSSFGGGGGSFGGGSGGGCR